MHVRRAVAFAIDRERWARARNCGIRPAGQMLPPEHRGLRPEAAAPAALRPCAARTTEMRAGRPSRRAARAGHPVDRATARPRASTASWRRPTWRKIGIELRLKPVSFPVYLEETGKPRTAQMVGGRLGRWTSPIPRTSSASSAAARKRRARLVNRSFYSDPELDALLERAIVERDPAKRAAMYREANDFVADAGALGVLLQHAGAAGLAALREGLSPASRVLDRRSTRCGSTCRASASRSWRSATPAQLALARLLPPLGAADDAAVPGAPAGLGAARAVAGDERACSCWCTWSATLRARRWARRRAPSSSRRFATSTASIGRFASATATTWASWPRSTSGTPTRTSEPVLELIARAPAAHAAARRDGARARAGASGSASASLAALYAQHLVRHGRDGAQLPRHQHAHLRDGALVPRATSRFGSAGSRSAATA